MLADYMGGRECENPPLNSHLSTLTSHLSPLTFHLTRLSFADWTGKVMIASAAEKALTPLMEEKVRFGIRAHALLASVLHADDAPAALERFSMRENIDDDERVRLESLLHDVLTHPDTARFFLPAYKVKNECDLTDGTLVGRPDRVVFTPDETWVVDFKTGHDLRGEYDRQLQHYCHAVAAMGYPNVSGWLVFLQPSVFVRQVMLDVKK
jgi:ATP-dependent exoDNAse (exonuclease V) beta subunit